MPYGISKAAGGDSHFNVMKVEHCVQQLQAKGHSKVSSIRICKDSIQKARTKRA